jgi:hypothetical protein
MLVEDGKAVRIPTEGKAKKPSNRVGATIGKEKKGLEVKEEQEPSKPIFEPFL